jgi:hypothetical protein
VLVLAVLGEACAGSDRPGSRRAAPAPAPPLLRVQPAAVRRVARLAALSDLGVTEGSSCGQAEGRGRIEMEGSETLPSFATAATVLLNGWKLRYLRGDHHVRAVYAAIEAVRLDGPTLRWTARGELSDRNADDAYEFCYWYVVLAWNQSVIDASTGNDNVESSASTTTRSVSSDAVDESHPPAYASAYVRNAAAVGKRTIAILPRGFGLEWVDQVDTHLLQLSYVLGQTGRFLTAGTFYGRDVDPFPGPSRMEDGLVSWRSGGILKNNEAKREFRLQEHTTALFGNGVDVLQPPYAPPPRDNGDVCGDAGGSIGVEIEEEVAVENLPFQAAIPMLSGWEPQYRPCDDEHVREVGVWVHDFSTTGTPPTSTLRYKISSILRDKNDEPRHFMSHKVNVLGIGVGGPPAKR